ncbi:2-oxo-4-hydroxy-4-carboxy-5-ureidoimidazoline decarboxylase [Cohnella nanjingensis]|uniref:2-oxo-4-hydroxy-4-carboxy-5-ureidoimidazoline decarboxylase n=1 Tax=Cohnella nanjingensis TaxID=1387779 RepID=A0A7X0S0J7_9BACL|nr:2-oxo-4-hydroxy-4-carboxy-5-ureidoimidazoline decarboxylase [Cohnella nanjingensis]MBB6675454.1 2-oxo-4-hydroxy-4-carboxy-5-ureidoimidazoline decarboxylase [Cohnella nanjingensis]
MSAAPHKIPMLVVSKMSRAQFVGVLGGIFEHSPWVAEQAWEARPFRTREALHEAMMTAVAASPEARILELLCAHPDLGTRLAVTDYSASEQQGAGLDRLTPEEYGTFSAANRAYVDKFGFPFILAVRGKTKDDILEAMKARQANEPAAERAEALAQIKQITGWRLADLLGA